ncbi:hypothetical protein GCM10010365_14510 [Streptomyces poonensis]|uniref:Uncharacterized protein n=2 Tax=Streptomyces poonensis TaxID=68255 RepID=A0A918UDK8_9ACTN|nr:hypothetical protein GCM10010365_14510 [Streptomyces poonensis]
MTLVQGLAPAEFLARLGADPQGEFAGFDAFAERDVELQDSQEPGCYGDCMSVGATSVPGHGGPWTLAVEFDGSIGTDDRLMTVVSAGTRIVSHFRNINALRLFRWWEDGVLRTAFESPLHRSGSTPDELTEVMARVGFDLVDGGSDVAMSLALAEELTGVRVTADVLDNALYTTGIVELPSEEWTGVVIDITDAHGERFYREFTREQIEQGMEQRRTPRA